MFKSDVKLHTSSNQEVTLPNEDQIYIFSGICGHCNKFIYKHPAEAGAIWFISGDVSKQYNNINLICRECYV